MAKYSNRSAYPLKENPVLEDSLLITDSQEANKTKTVEIKKVLGLITGSSLNHHYKANLNKENNTGVSATILNGSLLPNGVVIEYNYDDGSNDPYCAIIKITGWDNNKLFIPQSTQSSLNRFDEAVSTFRYEKTVREVFIYFEFKAQPDMLIMKNFPFEIYFYN